MVTDMTMDGTASVFTGVRSMKHKDSEETVLRIRNNSQICVIHHYGEYTQFQIGDIRKLKYVGKKHMVPIPSEKSITINCPKMPMSLFSRNPISKPKTCRIKVRVTVSIPTYQYSLLRMYCFNCLNDNEMHWLKQKKLFLASYRSFTKFWQWLGTFVVGIVSLALTLVNDIFFFVLVLSHNVSFGIHVPARHPKNPTYTKVELLPNNFNNIYPPGYCTLLIIFTFYFIKYSFILLV